MHRYVSAVLAALLIIGLTASVALAGEVTGNGRTLTIENSKWGTGLHARSVCAYSGQEDLQFFQDEETDLIPVENFVRGVPGHAQSWGQIPKADRDFLTSVGAHPGQSCNPHGGHSE